MTNKEWNKGIKYLQNAEEGMWVENEGRKVVVEEMMAGRFMCIEGNEFVKLAETEVEAMLFLKGE